MGRHRNVAPHSAFTATHYEGLIPFGGIDEDCLSGGRGRHNTSDKKIRYLFGSVLPNTRPGALVRKVSIMSENTVIHGAVAAAEPSVREAALEAEDARRTLVAELAGLGATMAAAMDADPSFMPCGQAFGVVIDGLAAAAASTSAVELGALSEVVRARSEHVAAHRGVSQGSAADVRHAMGEASGKPTMRAHLLAELMGIALAAQRGMSLGVMSDEVNELLVRGLDALSYGEDTEYVVECLANCASASAHAFALVA